LSDDIESERKRLAELKDQMSVVDYAYIQLTGGFAGDSR
jgi:hypothetical protein